MTETGCLNRSGSSLSRDGIDNYPVLVVADGPPGIEEIDNQAEHSSPNYVEFEILENRGLVTLFWKTLANPATF